MAKWFVYALRLLVILELAWTKTVPEDVRQIASERRVFAHPSSGRDAVTGSMFQVYESYSKDPRSHKLGNTVRSFTAVPSESRAHALTRTRARAVSITETNVKLTTRLHSSTVLFTLCILRTYLDTKHCYCESINTQF